MRLAFILANLGTIVGVAVGVVVAAALTGFIPGLAAYDIRLAENLYRANMFDAESARFRNVARHSPTFPGKGAAHTAVCGEVNGKNKYGGYVGFQRFVVEFPSQQISSDPEITTTQDDVAAKRPECERLHSDGMYEAASACWGEAIKLDQDANTETLFEATWTVDCKYPAAHGN